MPTDGTLAVKDAALALGVHPITVRRWIARGILPARRIGPRLIRIRKADVDRLAAG